MKSLLRLLRYSAFALIVSAILISGGLWLYLSQKQPQLDGTLTTAHVQERARVVRDPWGVPHIQAQNPQDAYFTLGFVTAQDRLFQMELQRRLAKGELAEILGPDLVKVDKMFRSLLLRHRAQEMLDTGKAGGQGALTLLDAFLGGINHFINTQPLPVEFTLLGFTPAPFTRLDTLSVIGYMAYSFADGIKRDALYTILSESLTPRDLSMVFPRYDLDNRFTIMEGDKWVKAPPNPLGLNPSPAPGKKQFTNLFLALNPVFDMAETIVPPFIGSNSWVMAPSRSENGHALLANDPHIGIANPGVWYEVHMNYPGYENYGYHLPLIPFPLLAHNREKAWGLTMFENDDLDLYAETIHPEDPRRVKYKNAWAPVTTMEEKIKVKGHMDANLRIRITPHGPIISDFIQGYSGQPVSASWVYLKEDNPVLDVLHEMALAKTPASFGRAVSKLTAPGLNISYIDAKGNIAWWAAGRVPIRPGGASGLEIMDGASGKHEWQGYLPFEKNPQLVNPPGGMIITANNLPTLNPIEPAGILTGYFRSSDRAARIHTLLSQREKWTLEEMKQIQTDVHLQGGFPMSKQILGQLARREKELTPLEKQAFKRLEDWDGNMGEDTIGGSIFQFTTYHVLKQTLAPHMAPEHLNTYVDLVDSWSFLKRMLKVDFPPIQGKSAKGAPMEKEELILAGFKEAVKELAKRQGPIESWTWGNIHTVEYVHPIGRKKPLNHIFNIGPFPCPGASKVVNKMSAKKAKQDYKVASLPSTRRLVDCNAVDASVSIIPTGNSGNFLSPYYDNQAESYLHGEYRPMLYTREQIRQNSAHRLTLVPGNK